MQWGWWTVEIRTQHYPSQVDSPKAAYDSRPLAKALAPYASMPPGRPPKFPNSRLAQMLLKTSGVETFATSQAVGGEGRERVDKHSEIREEEDKKNLPLLVRLPLASNEGIVSVNGQPRP